MAVSCSPADIVKAAKCFACMPRNTAPLVKSFLLCQIAVKADPTAPCSTPSAPKQANVPKGFSPTATTITVAWSQPPNPGTFIKNYEVFWGTTPGGPYPFNSGPIGLAPRRYTITGLSGATTYYYVIQALGSVPGCNSALSTEANQTTLDSCTFSPAICDWANRVAANGDPRPSNTILAAYDTWYKAIVTAGLSTGKIIANCWLNAKPNTIITNTTPLFKNFGSDPWGIGADIVAADFTVNGLLGASAQTNKYLKTGVIPATAFPSANSAGFAIYNYNDPGNNHNYYGGCTQAANVNLYECPNAALAGTGYFFTCFFGGGDFIQWNTGGDGASGDAFNGWISSQRTGAGTWNIYAARSTFPHASVGSSANAPGAATVGFEIYILNLNVAGVPTATTTNNTASFAIITQGLTSAEDTALFNATQALLTTIGGGFR